MYCVPIVTPAGVGGPGEGGRGRGKAAEGVDGAVRGRPEVPPSRGNVCTDVTDVFWCVEVGCRIADYHLCIMKYFKSVGDKININMKGNKLTDVT